MLFNYVCFNQQFISDMPLPLRVGVSDGVHTIIIQKQFIQLPESDEVKSIGLSIQCHLDIVYLKIDNIVQFAVSKNFIGYQPLCTHYDDIAPFILYSAIPLCLTRLGYLVLRGCALSFDGRVAECWLSHSGAGTSTLLAYALSQGAIGVSDHLCVLQKQDEAFLVLPGFQSIKLWHDAALQLNLPTQNLKKVRSALRQYWHDCDAQFHSLSMPVEKLFFIEWRNAAVHPELNEMKGVAKLKYLSNGQWMRAVLSPLKLLSMQNQLGVQLMSEVDLYTLHYARGMCDVTQVFAELIARGVRIA